MWMLMPFLCGQHSCVRADSALLVKLEAQESESDRRLSREKADSLRLSDFWTGAALADVVFCFRRSVPRVVDDLGYCLLFLFLCITLDTYSLASTTRLAIPGCSSARCKTS
jgi:hypothetical protein